VIEKPKLYTVEKPFPSKFIWMNLKNFDYFEIFF
jgi:hypothetical protein